MRQIPFRLAKWTRAAALLLSGIAVLYCMAWAFLGLAFAMSGTVGGVLFYAMGYALTAMPMVAYWLAGCIQTGEIPIRKGALWGIAVMLPPVAMFVHLFRDAIARGLPTQRAEVLVNAFYTVPGILATFLIGAFTVLAWRGQSAA